MKLIQNRDLLGVVEEEYIPQRKKISSAPNYCEYLFCEKHFVFQRKRTYRFLRQWKSTLVRCHIVKNRLNLPKETEI